MTERMAVAVREGSLSCGTHMGKDERGGGLAGETFEINAVPSGDRRGEDTRFWAESWGSVVADAEPVTVVGTACILRGWEVSWWFETGLTGGKRVYQAEPGVV